MDTFFFYSGFYLCLLMLLPLYRAVFGPTVLDRLVGVNAIGSKTTVMTDRRIVIRIPGKGHLNPVNI